MPKQKAIWIQVTEFNDIAAQLKERYPEVFSELEVDELIAWAVSNKSRPEKKKKFYEISAPPEPESFTNEKKVIVKYFKDDWENATEQQKQWLVFEAMARVDTEADPVKIRPLDYQGLSLILRTAGLNWETNPSLPDLIRDKIDFHIEEDLGEEEDPDEP